MVTDGAAETVAPVVALNPVEGVQVYVLAPEAVSNVLLPGQMVDDAAETKTTGNVLTVSKRVAGTLHPVTETVYVPAVLTLIAWVVAPVDHR